MSARRRRRRRRNPEASYLVTFGLAASALVAVLYIGKRLSMPRSLPEPDPRR